MKILVIAAEPGLGGLLPHVLPLGETMAAVVGARDVADAVAAQGVASVVWFDPGSEAPPEAMAGAVAEFATTYSPDVVIAPSRSAERVLLAAAAARLRAPLLPDVTGLSDVGGLQITRVADGGLIQERDVVTGRVAILMGGGLPTPSGVTASVSEHPGASNGTRVVSVEPVSTERVDLTAAPVVVAVGRGLKDQADLLLVDQLASRLGGAVGCTRPMAEGDGWFTHDRYIGISGQVVAPKLYLALGVSGQLQHVVGMRNSGTVVAVNTDAKAQIFQEADYGIVGDVHQVLPALLSALG